MSDVMRIMDLRSPRQWTGWTVLITLLGFFGVIFAVNGVMIYAALSTLSGTDTDSAYQAGLQYEQEVAQARGAGRAALAGRRETDAFRGR